MVQCKEEKNLSYRSQLRISAWNHGPEAAVFQIGTTVRVSNLFVSLPVRRKDFQSHLKRELNKAINRLNAYAIISKGQFKVESRDGRWDFIQDEVTLTMLSYESIFIQSEGLRENM